MPKYAKMLKDLLTNKEKLLELANTPLNENCSAVLLRKLPEKLGDPGKFLIPCDFSELEECMALADLGVSINLMPLYVWKMLMLPELVPTCMTLELANRSVAYPAGIAEDVFVQVGKFTFPADFIVVDYNVDLRVPLILRRPFLRTARALVDVHEKFYNSLGSAPNRCIYASEGDILFLEELLNDDLTNDLLPPKELKNDEIKTAKSSIEDPFELELKDLPPHLEYAFLKGTSKLPVIIAKDLKREEKDQLVKVLKSHKRAIAWKISDIMAIDPNFCTHKILMEDDFKPDVQHQRRVNQKINEVIKAEVIKLLDVGLIYPISDSPLVSPVHVVPKKGGMTVMLERLAGNEFYCFLDGFSGYFQIPIDPQDQEKTTFTCPYGTFAYAILSLLPLQFRQDAQMVEDTNLSSIREKCHFMVKEGIVFDHKISKSGIKVDHAKVDVIAKLSPPTMVKGIRSFLGHAGFYRRFIQDFSKIARPMTHLLDKETPFLFSKECMESFEILKTKLTEALILVAPDWDLPFEIMCDDSDFAMGAVLGQRKDKKFRPIHYASKTLSDAQTHYTTTEKELLAVVYTFEKFWSYLVLSKTIVYTDHLALKYLFAKQDA
ncbi:DNA-directed DNA polymerase [Tanacetum coccineum]